jgi:hypothetical protein
MLESVEMLERLANPQPPPLSLAELERIRSAFMSPSSDKVDLRRQLEGMALAFEGRGDLSRWQFEMLDAIDECFIDNFMKNGEVSTSLFAVDNAANINNYSKYCDAVDQRLRSSAPDRPEYAREYFAYLSIWQVHGYPFPVPLGTQSVMQALDTLATDFRPGFVEVRHITSKCLADR